MAILASVFGEKVHLKLVCSKKNLKNAVPLTKNDAAEYTVHRRFAKIKLHFTKGICKQRLGIVPPKLCPMMNNNMQFYFGSFILAKICRFVNI